MIHRRNKYQKKIDDILNGKHEINQDAPGSHKTALRKQQEDELCWAVIKYDWRPFTVKMLAEETCLSVRKIQRFCQKNKTEFDRKKNNGSKQYIYSLKIEEC